MIEIGFLPSKQNKGEIFDLLFAIFMYKIKRILDERGWNGWLVIERSRNVKKPSDTKYNYGANTTYLKKVFRINFDHYY
jgi:hypothetical protein